MSDIRSVDERLTEAAPIDLTAAHQQFARGMRELADTLYAAFPVRKHPCSSPFAEYSDPGGLMRGSLAAYTSDALDWVVDSWIGSPSTGFSNHHLTVWLPPTIDVPHLALAIGTIPQVFVFCDLVPRGDLWVDTAQLDRYHATFNERFMRIAADERFAPFISRDAYIRQAASPIALCQTCDVRPDAISEILALFRETLDTWIGWVKDAEPLPEHRWGPLGKRDRQVRHTIAQRDPANVVAEKVLGKEMTDRLVAVLSGAARQEG